jgi:photosystem II stability/assembly factor-like uncharacterized protein
MPSCKPHFNNFTGTNNGEKNAFSIRLLAQQNNINRLGSVACDTTGLQCAVVSSSKNGDSTIPLIFNSTDGGNTWGSPATLPTVKNSGDHFLADISCDNTGLKCITIASSYSNNSVPLSYNTTNGGNTWVESTTISSRHPRQNLRAISCDVSGKKCVIVGEFFKANGNYSYPIPVVYTTADSGDTWEISLTPDVDQGELMDIACDSDAQHCIAVGNYITESGGIPMALVSFDGGGTWSRSTIPTPQNSITYQISGIACDKSGKKCAAVGHFFLNSTGEAAPLSYVSMDGGITWDMPTTLPPIYNSYSYCTLDDVTCDSTGEKYLAIGSCFNGKIFPAYRVVT